MHAIEIRTQKEKWRIETGSGALLRPALADGILYFGTQAGLLHAVDSHTGEELWRFETGDVDWPIRDRFVNGQPTITGGVVYFSSEDWNVYALDAKTGEERWRFRLGEEPQALQIPVRDGVAYIGGWDGYLYAIDVTSGTEKWRSTTDNDHIGRTLRDEAGDLYWVSDAPNGETLPRQAPYVTVVPIVTEEAVYFTDWSGNLMAVGVDDGVQLWRFKADAIDNRHAGSRFYIALRGDVLYFATVEDRHLYGVDRHTGAKVWESTTPYPAYGPLPWGGDVLLYMEAPLDESGSSTGFELHAIDAESKEPLWTRFGLSAPPYVEDDLVYCPLSDGTVIAVDRREGSEVWRLGRSGD